MGLALPDIYGSYWIKAGDEIKKSIQMGKIIEVFPSKEMVGISFQGNGCTVNKAALPMSISAKHLWTTPENHKNMICIVDTPPKK